MANKDYMMKNRHWLQEKAKEADVKTLPKGILYKVLQTGEGAQPSARSIITAHYKGTLIDGSEFDSSYGGCPLAIRLSDLIEGWIIALTRMHVGDKWEIYLPAEMGYGNMSQPGIPGGSTLIFTIELIAVG